MFAGEHNLTTKEGRGDSYENLPTGRTVCITIEKGNYDEARDETQLVTPREPLAHRSVVCFIIINIWL